MNINRKDFLEEHAFLSHACERKAPIVVHGYFLFSAEAGNIDLHSTTITLTAKTSIECDGIISEKFCLPLFETMNALKNMTAETVELTVEDNRVWLKDAKSKNKLPILPASDFPEPSKDENGVEFSISAPLLQKLIRLSSFACDSKNKHATPVKQNVFVRIAGHNLEVWALDGILMSYLTVKGSVPTPDGEFSFPFYFARPCSTICEGAETITLKSSKNNLSATAGKRSLITNLIVAQSPPIQKVRFENPITFRISQSELKRAIQAVHGFDDLVDKSSYIRFLAEDGNLRSYSTSSEYDAESILDCEALVDFKSFALDGFHLSRMLSALGPGTLDVSLKKASTEDEGASTIEFIYEDDDLTMETYLQGLRLLK